MYSVMVGVKPKRTVGATQGTVGATRASSTQTVSGGDQLITYSYRPRSKRPLPNLTMSLTFTCTAGCIGWACLFFASIKFLTPRSLSKQKDRVYYASSAVGIVHALYTGLSAVYLLGSGELPMWDRFGESSPAWERVVAISFGYFVYDAALVLLSPSMPGRAEILLHHFLGLTMHFTPVCVYQKFAALSCVGYVCELSSPFVNARWMLKEAGGGSGTTLYLLNGLAIVLSFLVFRVIGLLVCLYQIFVLVPRHASPSFADLGPLCQYLVPAGALVFYALNLFWFFKIISGALKLLAPAKRGAKRRMGAAADQPQLPPIEQPIEAYPVKSK